MKTTQEIKEAIEQRTGLKLDSKGRRRELVYCRAIYFKLCRENTELSLHKISDTLGMSHCNVIYSLRNTFPLIMKHEYKYSSMYKILKSPDPIEDIQEKYIRLKEDYEALLKSTEAPDDAELVDIIRQIPEQQIDVAKLRINAMVQMLKTY
tara:strand:+ start:179 stop:631 length:453 start_codon:yes stop_codon:yes gene_type:complete